MQSYRTFSVREQANRDAWTTQRMENDCEGCEADGDLWRPAENCPVHGVSYRAWWAALNAELDARWPGVWHAHCRA